MLRIVAVGIAALVVGGCVDHEPFPCSSSEQCVRGEDVGTCETAGFCSFAAPECPSGRRFAERAGDGLADTCVEPQPRDAGPCGAEGEPCCAERGCEDGMVCGADSMCVPCGELGASCCDGGSCVEGAACGEGSMCVACGELGASCCDGGSCVEGAACGEGSMCVACGELGAPCCDGGSCVEGAICGADSTCAACGEVGGPCCDGGSCAEGAICGEDSMCAACGKVGGPCCDGDTCGDNAFCGEGMCRQCVLDITMGRRHSCVLRHDNTVWCFGENEVGQRGNGALGSSPSATPTQATATASLSPIQDAVAIGAGREHTCAVRTAGSVWCWGNNEQGQLGDGETDTESPFAVRVIRADDMSPLTGIVELAGGDSHTCARDGDGAIWCWGANGRGQLGDPSVTGNRPRASQVLADEAEGAEPFGGAIEVAAGSGHNCARDDEGGVWCWGRNTNGQIGSGAADDVQAVPVRVITASSMDTGRYHTCAVQADTSVWCWGQGWRGRLGNGSDWDDESEPARVLTMAGGEPFEGATAVAAGGVSCALMSDQGAFCWSTNQYGQTGAGAGGLAPLAVRTAAGAPLGSVERLVASYNRVCAYLVDGTLLCWGRNSEGQLGDRTMTNRGFPTPVTCP